MLDRSAGKVIRTEDLYVSKALKIVLVTVILCCTLPTWATWILPCYFDGNVSMNMNSSLLPRKGLTYPCAVVDKIIEASKACKRLTNTIFPQ